MDPAGLDRLLPRARRRDPEALQAIFDAYHRRVYGLLVRLTGSHDAAEDLLQETFLRVVRTIDQYEHSGRFEAWLFRIAANLARDHARRHKRRDPPDHRGQRTPEGEPAARVAARSGPVEPERRLMAAEAGERLNGCLARLAEMDREIILLRHFAELSFKEIAELLGIPLGTALARAHRALKRLRAEYGED